MHNIAGRILKSSDIKLEGLFQLSTIQPDLISTGHQSNQPATTQARVVENQVDFAIIEVTCRCGSKIYLRCEYACEKTVNEGLETQDEPAETPDNVTEQIQ
jgi:hypothetical protein